MKEVIEAIIILSPAMVANMAATPSGLLAKHCPQLGPIDQGKLFYDKKPILGSGKTWAGFLGGVLVASLFLFILALIWRKEGLDLQKWVVFGFVVGMGALTGDLCKSFIKRRLGFGKDTCLLIADQLDFVVGAGLAYLFLLYAGLLANIPWTLTLPGFLAACGVILIAHPLVNWFAYKLALKRVPY